MYQLLDMKVSKCTQNVGIGIGIFYSSTKIHKQHLLEFLYNGTFV